MSVDEFLGADFMDDDDQVGCVWVCGGFYVDLCVQEEGDWEDEEGSESGEDEEEENGDDSADDQSFASVDELEGAISFIYVLLLFLMVHLYRRGTSTSS